MPGRRQRSNRMISQRSIVFFIFIGLAGLCYAFASFSESSTSIKKPNHQQSDDGADDADMPTTLDSPTNVDVNNENAKGKQPSSSSLSSYKKKQNGNSNKKTTLSTSTKKSFKKKSKKDFIKDQLAKTGEILKKDDKKTKNKKSTKVTDKRKDVKRSSPAVVKLDLKKKPRRDEANEPTELVNDNDKITTSMLDANDNPDYKEVDVDPPIQTDNRIERGENSVNSNSQLQVPPPAALANAGNSEAKTGDQLNVSTSGSVKTGGEKTENVSKKDSQPDKADKKMDISSKVDKHEQSSRVATSNLTEIVNPKKSEPNVTMMSPGPINARSEQKPVDSGSSRNVTMVPTTAKAVVSNEIARTDSHVLVKKGVDSGTIDMKMLLDKIESLESQVSTLQVQLNDKPENRKFPVVSQLDYKNRLRILVTGGAGFVGSHLVDRLMSQGHEVIAVDNFFTGRRRNVQHWIGHPHFELVHRDIVNPIYFEVDQIYHLASPASPPHYMYNPVKTIKTNTIGTINMLGLARRVKARVLLASTSEVYGDPEIHPQDENYWGHVNPVGPRSCYDEGKRVAESLMVAYNKQENVDIRIARIFNTFGPRMHLNDGRVVSNFILQAVQNKPITIYGAGNQTRSFQFVSDLVDGLIALMNSNVSSPVNIGTNQEFKITEFAELIKNLTDSKSEIKYVEKAEDDPQRRRPDISKAKQLIGWEPKKQLEKGLRETIDYFKKELASDSALSTHQAPLEHFDVLDNN